MIEVATCSHRTTRGYSFAAVIADECAFWRKESSANPDVEVIAAIRPGARAPLTAAAEYGAEFRSDLEGYLARYELPPLPDVRYVAFTDPSGGSGDSCTLAIAHQDTATGHVILDVIREGSPRSTLT